MNIIDIIILVALIPAITKGLKDGLLKQAAGVAGLLAGVYLAYKFSDLLSTYLNNWINTSEQVVKIISFALIILVVIICLSLLGKWLTKILEVATLGWINKLLGVIIAIAIDLTILGVIAYLITYINSEWFVLVPKESITDSKFFSPILNLAQSVFPYLKSFFV
ncbi:MAG: CvpA family protein [Bacteroidales bacterium]